MSKNACSTIIESAWRSTQNGIEMKKNLLSVLILALLVVNLVLTAIMLFSVTGAMSSTTSLVGKIATVLDIELAADQNNEVSIEDTETYTIADTMTIPLKDEVDSEGKVKEHYAMVKVTLYLNKKHEDYSKFGSEEDLAAREEMIKSEIIAVIRSHTMEEFKDDSEGIYAEIVTRLQKMYNSKFIYRVACGDVKYS